MSDRPTYNLGPVRVDKDSLVSVGSVVAIVVLILGGWRYLEDRFQGIQAEIREGSMRTDRRLERLEQDEARRMNDRWTYTDQRLWVSEFMRANPSMNIPTPEK